MSVVQPTPRGHREVVGVDGTPASVNALRYALQQATRTGGEVEAVHVVPDFAPMAGMYPIPPGDLLDAGRAALASTLRAVGEGGDGNGTGTVKTHLVRGAVVKTLVDASRKAQEIVVGSDRRPTSLRLLTGNVSTGVAARASVPVVCVPETWEADRTIGTVLVAVKHRAHADALMAEAFEVARRRSARLVVLHAWRFPTAYEENIDPDPSRLAEWAARARQELESIVAPWRRSYPEIGVELRAVHDQSAHALVDASEQADELVMVRRGDGFPSAAHLGSTARTVLLYAHCPVRVVPAAHAPVLPDLELEAAGAPLT